MSSDPHRRQRAAPAEDEDEEDPVEAMISKTGCLEKHYAVQVRAWRAAAGAAKLTRPSTPAGITEHLILSILSCFKKAHVVDPQ